jgi:pyrroline-5-carboxylate reductase
MDTQGTERRQDHNQSPRALFALKGYNMRIGIIGAGQMGRALLEGILRSKIASVGDIMVCDVVEAARQQLTDEIGVATTSETSEVVAGVDVVVIAVKPQIVPAVLPTIAGVLVQGQTVLSIAAGIATEQLESLLGGDTGAKVRVVRAMPNTPALVGEGVSAICEGAHAESVDLDRAESILGAVGYVVRLPESQMDAVTGLSGSGPGYIYTVIEALADGGCRVGLPKALALELAARTVLGTARMVIETGEHPAVLRDRVTSPGGTTIAGLHAAEGAGLRNALISAVKASADRASELGSI